MRLRQTFNGRLTRLAGLVAVFLVGVVLATGVRSLVLETASADPAPPNPGHSWSQIGDFPGTMWHSNNDGSGSGLDADRLDGQDSGYYRNAGNLNAGTLSTSRYSAYGDLGAEGYLGDASGDLARNNGAVQTNLNADMLDGQQGDAFFDSCSEVDSCNNAGSIRHFEWMGSVLDTPRDIYDNGYVKIQEFNTARTFRLFCGHPSGCTYVYYLNGARTGGTLGNGGTVNINMAANGNDARFLFAKTANGMDMLVCDVIDTNASYLHFICHDTK